jgi:hypothetical protein
MRVCAVLTEKQTTGKTAASSIRQTVPTSEIGVSLDMSNGTNPAVA